ncbi:ATP-dependent DNA helicase Snf21, partial [Basidiobolus ranarum]
MNPTGTSQIQHHLSGTSPQINGPITQEKLRTLFATVQSMRARGATEASDPEYAQIMNFLRIYSKQQGIQQMMQHQQQSNSLAHQTVTQYQQPQISTPQQYQTMQYPSSQVQGDPVQQQLPQLPQMQHSPVQLNRHPQNRDSVNSITQSGLHSSPLQQQLPTPLQTQPESQINSRSQPNTQRISQGTPPNQSPVFTQEQLTALKYQIYAYKLLSKNLPLPEHLQRTLFSHLPTEEESTPIIATNEPESTQRPSPILSTEGSLSSPALIRKPVPDQKSIKSKSTGHFVSPYSYVREPITSYAHASRQQKVIIPTITPNGVDPCQIIEHHQNQIQSRIKSRIEELEKMSVSLFSESCNLANDGISDEAFKAPDLPCKVDTLIELKGLKMLERQKKLREEIYKGAGKSTTLVAVTDPNAFRRVKRLSLREARMTENLERQQRADRERQERQKHLDRLQNIIIHGRDMIQWHRTLQIKQSRLGKSVVQYHAHVEKEEQKRIERISKERLNALKADDEEAYLKLIDQTKDTRITHLLKQTDSYLDDLTRAVRVQQNDSLHYDPSTKGGDELMDRVDDGDSDEDMERRIDYYAIAHRFGEEVSQPDFLGGGR